MPVLEILLRGVAAGAMLAVAAGLLRGRGPARWSGGLFALAAASFAVHSQGAETEALGVLGPLVWLLSAGGAGWFWLLAASLFEDRPFGWDRLVPGLGLTAIAGVAELLPRATADGVWIAHNLMEIGLVAHVLVLVWRSWGGDLVEARRSLRGPFMAVVALYAMLLSGLEIGEALGLDAARFGLVQAASLAALAALAAWVFLAPRAGLFAPPVREPEPQAVGARDRPALEALQALMAGDEAWRREGLTIGALAAELGTPEHRLRRIINDGLGHRNFADFLNGRRIEAAKAALADPAQARTSVSAIAFDLGYASLGPFNRAFRQATGTTPSAWRERTLSSPEPEKAG